jgi:hypothetical protein
MKLALPFISVHRRDFLMKRILSMLAVGMLSAWAAAAQTSASAQAGASAQSQSAAQAYKSGAEVSGSGSGSAVTSASAKSGNSSASVSNGTKVDATLASSLDAKKSKPGDRVVARTAQDVKQDGKVVLKSGTRLEGHVTQAQARAKGQPQSQLGIVFDHAVLKNGQEVPFSATIQALAAAQSAAAATSGADDMMASGGGMGAMSGSARGSGGLVGGVASTAGVTTGAVVNTASPVSSTAGGTLNAASRSAGAVGGLTSAGRLASNSKGVFGLEGISIDSMTSTATQGSLIVSSTKNVHLSSGTQLLLRASGAAK